VRAGGREDISNLKEKRPGEELLVKTNLKREGRDPKRIRGRNIAEKVQL